MIWWHKYILRHTVKSIAKGPVIVNGKDGDLLKCSCGRYWVVTK